MKKIFVKVVIALLLLNPWYVQAELDLSIPPEELVLAKNDATAIGASRTILTSNAASAHQNNFTIGSGRSSPLMIIAVAVVIALVAVKVSSASDK